MAVIGRTQEKCSSVPVLQGSTWTGSCPRAWISTSYKMHPIQWNWYIYCYVLPHWCLQVFISSKDSDRLERSSPPEPSSLLIPSRKPSVSSQTLLLTVAEPATPAVTGDHPSLDTHWRTEEQLKISAEGRPKEIPMCLSMRWWILLWCKWSNIKLSICGKNVLPLQMTSLEMTKYTF